MVSHEQPSPCLNGCKPEDKYDESWYDKVIYAFRLKTKGLYRKEYASYNNLTTVGTVEIHYVLKKQGNKIILLLKNRKCTNFSIQHWVETQPFIFT